MGDCAKADIWPEYLILAEMTQCLEENDPWQKNNVPFRGRVKKMAVDSEMGNAYFLPLGTDTQIVNASSARAMKGAA